MNKKANNYNKNIALSLFLFFCYNTKVQALPAILDSWATAFPNSNSDSASCQLCHQSSSGGDAWNGYGWAVRQAYLANGGNALAAITVDAVKTSNSDNDPANFTNGEEISANTQPGWTAGNNNTIYFKSGSVSTLQPPPTTLTQLDPQVIATPDIDVSPAGLSFSADLGASSPPKSLSIGNVGNSSLTINGIGICSGSASEFKFTSASILPIILAPGAQTIVEVSYSPTNIGLDNDCLQINSNDPDEAALKIPLSGQGMDISGRLLDIDISGFTVSANADVGADPVTINLAVKNNGLVQGTARASVTGKLSGSVVYAQVKDFNSGIPGQVQVLAFPNNFPQLAGTIVWDAEVTDQDPDIDSATSNTTVTSSALVDPIPNKILKGNVSVGFETVTSGLIAPNYGTYAPGILDHLYVVDQPGQVWRINLKTRIRSLFMDVSGRLVPLGFRGPSTFDERGLLGLAFHPKYASNGLIYTYTSEPVCCAPDFSSTLPVGVVPNHQAVITEWKVTNYTSANGRVDMANDTTSGRRVLLRIDEPQFNHNGGTITFGPDGLLYMVFGDGGAADDQGDGHGLTGNGQNPRTPLGAILRIDPLGNNSRNGRYGVPLDNPFYGRPSSGLDEVYAYGLRNAYRMAFDTKAGTLYAADVGQNKIEEVNVIVKGGNYGWNRKEGTFFFNPNGTFSGFVTNIDPGNLPPNLIDPVWQYDHDEGISVTGGFVYRGRLFKGLNGTYVFGDWSKSFSIPSGRLFYQYRNEIREFLFTDRQILGIFLAGFGQDQNGEIYLMGNKTGIPFRDSNNVATGQVLKMVPDPK